MATIKKTTNPLSSVQNLSQYGGGVKGVGKGVAGGGGGSFNVTKPIVATSTTPIAKPKVNTPVVSAPTIGKTTPVVIPKTPTLPTKTPTVSAPVGTTANQTGSAVPTPKTETPTQSNYQKILEKMQGFGDSLGGKADAERKLQKEQQLAQKTEQATRDYNTYTQKKLQYEQEIEKMRTSNPEGQFGGAREADIQEYSRRANADLANLAVVAQMSQGLESAARQTIKDSIEAQFQPIQDQIDFYGKFAQLNQNDLSESEKFALQEGAAQKKADAASVQNVANQLGEAFLGDASAQAAINKVIADYTSGKITAQEATSQMYSSVGTPVDVQLDREYKRAQIGSANRANQDGDGGSAGLVTTSSGERGIKNADGSITAVSDINFDDPQQIDSLPVNDITKAVMGGYIKTKELTPTQKGLVASDLQKVGFNPNTYVAKKLDTLIESWSNVPEESKGVVQGLKFWERWTTPEVANFESNKAILTREIARLNDVGVLSDQDVESYNNAMPSRQDQSLDVVLNKASGIRSSITGESSGDTVGDIITLKDGRTAIVGADGDTLLDPKTGKKLE